MPKLLSVRLLGLPVLALALVPFQTVFAATPQQELNKAMTAMMAQTSAALTGDATIKMTSRPITKDGETGSGDIHLVISNRGIKTTNGSSSEGHIALDKFNLQGDTATDLPIKLDGAMSVDWKTVDGKIYLRLNELPSSLTDLLKTVGIDSSLVVNQWLNIDTKTDSQDILNDLPVNASSLSTLDGSADLFSGLKALAGQPILNVLRVEKQLTGTDGHKILRLRVQLNPRILTALQNAQLNAINARDPERTSKRTTINKTFSDLRAQLAKMQMAAMVDTTTGALTRLEIGGANTQLKQVCVWSDRVHRDVCHNATRETTTYAIGLNFQKDDGHAIVAPSDSITFQDLAAKIAATQPTEPVAPTEPEPTPVPEPMNSTLPPVTSADHITGPANAKVTLVEYSDFECPFCKTHFDTMNQILAEYPEDVRLVYRHFPLSFHQNAEKEAEASECVASLGGNSAFWSFYNTIFSQTDSGGTGYDLDRLWIAAKDAGVEQTAFQTCLDSGKFADTVAKQETDGEAAGVQGTPTTFVNGKAIEGAVPLADFEDAIDEILNK